ncbi:importin subunit alpha-6-like isoform X1 [Sinocyclocheilus grahami]|uniref:importin subunit alpha-6-like isoform X1 n=1 Tax=Sinocyclocheilus grahami TaxID=75366 RepID=UPI0007AD2609|nr:PREDICTED: importin subunit alpha-6-like isoform X1 [Sinocyclocheilus grahami]
MSSYKDAMASPGKESYRMKSYKNKALNPQEMRRRREEEGIQLRKQKREEQLFKRRNVSLPPGDESMLECPIQDPDISSTVPVSGVSNSGSRPSVIVVKQMIGL